MGRGNRLRAGRRKFPRGNKRINEKYSGLETSRATSKRNREIARRGRVN